MNNLLETALGWLLSKFGLGLIDKLISFLEAFVDMLFA